MALAAWAGVNAANAAILASAWIFSIMDRSSGEGVDGAGCADTTTGNATLAHTARITNARFMK